MADGRETTGIGQRVKALRRARGFKAPRDLAEALSGGNITTAVLENLESGRKADLSVSQLLNLARALRVPPSYLLAPVRSPGDQLDLPNLSDDFAGMKAGEFDSWFAGVIGSDYRSAEPVERLELEQLEAYRTMRRLQREAIRSEAIERAIDDDNQKATARSRRALVVKEAAELEDYLRASGWDLEPGS